MSNLILSKYCPRCCANCPTADFYKNRSSKDGLQSECKTCWHKRTQAYSQTPKGKQKNLESSIKYSKTEKGKASRKRADKKKSGSLKVSARAMVRTYVYRGKIPPAKSLPCHYCKGCSVEYHHHKGYDKENRLDVVPVCRPCHRKIEN